MAACRWGLMVLACVGAWGTPTEAKAGGPDDPQPSAAAEAPPAARPPAEEPPNPPPNPAPPAETPPTPTPVPVPTAPSATAPTAPPEAAAPPPPSSTAPRQGSPPESPTPGAPAPEAATPAATPTPAGAKAQPEDLGWVDDQRLALQERMGTLVQGFDRFFGDDRKQDLESPSTRLRLKGFVRTAQDRELSSGAAVGASVNLPRLEHLLGNARLVLVGENASPGTPVPPVGNSPPGEEIVPLPPSDATAAQDLPRSRGRAELRFDLYRNPLLILDLGVGFTFDWPPVPYTRVRAHLRVGLCAGLLFRATEVVFFELGGRGLGTTTDLQLERLLGKTVRLRWEGHALFAETTRGIEWNTLVGADWRVHPRTGLYTGVGFVGFGTPEPGLDTWRTWLGVRQDVWRGWIFAELEPEIAWPRPAGMARAPVAAITLRLELVLEGRPPKGEQP